MQEITHYIADDGTEFTFEDECREYEFDLKEKALADEFKIYDRDGGRVSVSDADFAYYISIKTERAFDFLEESMRCYYGYETPHGVGNWYYNDDTDKWESANDYIAKAEFMKKLFNKEG